MKLTQWLHISLALNLALCGWLAWSRHWHAAAAAKTNPGSALTNRSIRVFPPGPQNAAAPAQEKVVNEAFHWSQLESTDYRTYLANMRAIGCPEATIRDIILADLDELFRRRTREVVDTVQNQFWNLLSNKKDFEKLIEDKGEQLKKLEQELSETQEELLKSAHWKSRDDEESERETNQNNEQRLDFLPAEKRTLILAVESEFATKSAELSMLRPPLPQNEMRTRLKELLDQKEAQLQGAMTQGELEEYHLRNSRFANVRLSLASFDATETEVREMVRLQERAAGSADPANPSVDTRVTQRASADAQARADIKNLLGDQRYSEFQRAQDNRYLEMVQVTDRLDLPPQTAADAFEARRAAEDQARQLRADRSLSPEDRAAQLSALREGVEQTLTSAFGASAFEVYKTRLGQWLRQLDAAPR